MLSQTATSPWFPSQNVRETSVGLSGSEMSVIRNPSQFPRKASCPQKAMSVLMSFVGAAGSTTLAG
jgi:hypothetical protein